MASYEFTALAWHEPFEVTVWSTDASLLRGLKTAYHERWASDPRHHQTELIFDRSGGREKPEVREIILRLDGASVGDLWWALRSLCGAGWEPIGSNLKDVKDGPNAVYLRLPVTSVSPV